MKFQNVCLEALSYTLPPTSVTTAEIEQRLTPVYERLKLPTGRLEMMTGILERRFWPRGTLPSEISIESGRRVLQAAGIDPHQIGMLVHGSVCRDQLEPATACRVHWKLGLPSECLVYDTSNACLGMINGMLQAATLIELGHIQSALVIGTENGTDLVEDTIEMLNQSNEINRRNIKLAIASLTIGASSAAILLTHRSISSTGTTVESIVTRADTQHYQLCHGDQQSSDSSHRLLMNTDSETLMAEGIETGYRTFQKLLSETGETTADIQRSICHQVGMAHRKGMLDRLGLPQDRDFATVQWLGNTGACALPSALAIAAELEAIPRGSRVVLLGIGSGINCAMASIRWHGAKIQGEPNLRLWIPPSAKATWHLAGKNL
ncbi:MAG: 3-oxoacyl-ACP synthase III [Planctomycetaceae bacterium]|nr:3-oxoacyl-ACP synthase III [Planctomycetaceae bacterium]